MSAPVDGGEGERHEIGCDLTLLKYLWFFIWVRKIHDANMQGGLTICLDQSL
jgi:hypothetical protein